jgi:hypothetical protein
VPVWPLIARHWRIAAVLALVLALGVQSWRLDVTKADLRVERQLRERDRANYEAAQAVAQADFDRQVSAIVARNERANHEADQKAADTRIVFRYRVVRLPAASGCAAQGTDLPGADLSHGADGPRADTVILARADALICADNTARLIAAHEWATRQAD